MAGRLQGKRAIVTDPTEYNGADIVALFREEGGEVFAESWDMTKPEMADEIVREVGHVDILIANLAYPHTYAPAHTKTDADLEYAMQRIMYPLHRLTRAVLPQMLERSEERSSWSAVPRACACARAASPCTARRAGRSTAI